MDQDFIGATPMRAAIVPVAGGAVRPVAAAVSTVAGMAVLGLSDNLLRLVSDDGSLAQFHLLRALVALTCMAAVAALGFGSMRPRRLWPVTGRSIFTAVSMVIYFGCLAVMPISLVVAGFFTAPLWVLILSVVVLGKRVGWVRWTAVGLGAAGVALVIGPGAEIEGGAVGGLWLLAPVVAGFFYAVGAVTTRVWCEGEGTMALTTAFFVLLGLFGALGSVLLPVAALPPLAGDDGFVLRGWMPLTLADAGWIVAQGIGAVVGIVLIFRGYLLGEASHVAIFEYSLLLFASFWAWAIWGDVVSPIGIFGMVMIAAAGGVIALRGAR